MACQEKGLVIPRRANHHPKHRYRHSVESLTALVIGRSAWVSLWGNEEEGQAAYDALRHEPDHRGGRPLIVGSAVFFDYEPGVPPNLKRDSTSWPDSLRAWDELEERRLRWLLTTAFLDEQRFEEREP